MTAIVRDTAVTITDPAGSGPYTVTANLPTLSTDDMLILAVVSSVNSILAVNTPSGWTSLIRNTVAPPNIDVFYRVSDGGEGSTVGLQWDGTDPAESVTIAASVYDYDTGDPFLGETTAEDETAGPSGSMPADTLVLSFLGVRGVSTTTIVVPSGWTEHENATASGNNSHQALASITGTGTVTGEWDDGGAGPAKPVNATFGIASEIAGDPLFIAQAIVV